MKQLAHALAFAVVTILAPWNGAMAQGTGNDSRPGEFRTVEKVYENSRVDGYNLYIPDSYGNGSRAFPAIVFLQGGLGVGGTVDAIFNWELPRELKEAKALGSELDELKLNTFIYIMPHISEGQFYDNADALDKVIADVISQYNIDKRRVYLTGLSRGGHGTWGVASRTPERFAAIAPICGAAHGITDYRTLAKLPVLTAHNVADESIDYHETTTTVRKIEEISGRRFSQKKSISEVDPEKDELIFISGEGEGKGHNAWKEVYNHVNFYKWLLRHRKE